MSAKHRTFGKTKPELANHAFNALLSFALVEFPDLIRINLNPSNAIMHTSAAFTTSQLYNVRVMAVHPISQHQSVPFIPSTFFQDVLPLFLLLCIQSLTSTANRSPGVAVDLYSFPSFFDQSHSIQSG